MNFIVKAIVQTQVNSFGFTLKQWSTINTKLDSDYKKIEKIYY
jgi:hypothetical protein